MRPLRAIQGCFQGVIPAYISTSSAAGEPNVAAVSIVHLLGEARVGVSCQFMNKTIRNLRENPHAQILVLDPATLAEYALALRFEGLAEGGPVFERMRAQLDAIASQTGMTGIFGLTGVVEFAVVDWRKVGDAGPGEPLAPVPDVMEQLERITAAVAGATDLTSLFDQTFAVLASELHLQHGFLLLADGLGERLYNVASLGFDRAHAGAEVAFGEGLYGTAAARQTCLRTGSMSRERLLSQAVARTSERPGPADLPLPGLSDAESSVAVPLVRGDRCVGVLCFQSREPGAFSADCERVLTIVARHLSATLAVLGTGSHDVQVSARRGPVGSRALVTRVKYFESDGSVFIDDEYLIKGVAGRVLHRALSNYADHHRDEFSSKEIRLDPSVGLPALKDNLEARLIALRNRLQERTTFVRIEKTGRGRFRVDVSRELVIERLP